ncbi:MAG: uroporphyrinogen-III synthase [Chlamydiota bacterium]
MRRVLYLGINLPGFQEGVEFVHCPIIAIKRRDLESLRFSFVQFLQSTHLIFTSRHAVLFTMEAIDYFFGDYLALKDKIAIVIGPSTKEALSSCNITILQAKVFTQEGVISLLDQIDLSDAYLFYPRSSRARPDLAMYLQQKQCSYHVCDLYDTYSVKLSHLPSLGEFDEIIFTSPSTVEAFFSQIKSIPKHIQLTPIGPITAQAIQSQFLIRL